MKWRRSVQLAAGAILALGVVAAVVLVSVPKEPSYQGQPISWWIEQLTGPVGGSAGAVSSQALPQLLQARPGNEIVPYLRTTLHKGRGLGDSFYVWLYPKVPVVLRRKIPAPNPSRDAQLRYRAGLILYYVGPTAATALPDLRAALRDPETEVRRIAATALGELEASAAPATSDLEAAMRDSSPGVRCAAVGALARVAADSHYVSIALAPVLGDSDPQVRIEAARLLKDLGPKAKPAMPALIRALSDTDSDVIVFAAQALGRIGPEAKEALPVLEQTLQNSRPETRTTLQWALKKITVPQPNP